MQPLLKHCTCVVNCQVNYWIKYMGFVYQLKNVCWWVNSSVGRPSRLPSESRLQTTVGDSTSSIAKVDFSLVYDMNILYCENPQITWNYSLKFVKEVFQIGKYESWILKTFSNLLCITKMTTKSSESRPYSSMHDAIGGPTRCIDEHCIICFPSLCNSALVVQSYT